MALNKPSLKTDLKTLVQHMRTKHKVSDDVFAQGLADIIDAYVRSQTITITGITTAGSAAAQTQTAPVVATIT